MILEDIAKAHQNLTGWCSWKKAEVLSSAVIGLNSEITIEIGVWGGKSFIPMAMAHRHIGHGIAIAIDPWDTAASIAGQINPADVEWWSHQDRHEYAFQQFNTKIVELGLQNVVKIERKKSDEVEPPKDITIFHCDGNHGEQAIRDVRRFAPNVRVGGLLILDDLEWSGGSVMKSVNLAISLGFKEILMAKDDGGNNYWAIYQRIR